MQGMRSKPNLILLFLLSAFLVAGCASKSDPVKADAVVDPENGVRNVIEGVRFFRTDKELQIHLDARGHLTYTSVKQPFPPGVILYFPDTELQDGAVTAEIPEDRIRSLKAERLTDKGHTVRMEIVFREDAPYEVRGGDGEGLVVAVLHPDSVSAPVSPEPVQAMAETAGEVAVPAKPAETVPVATRMDRIETRTDAKGVVVSVKGNGTIRDLNAFTIAEKPRIVLDLNGVRSPYKAEQKLTVGNEWVKTVRHYGSENRLRVVIDTQRDWLDSYVTEPTADGLDIRIGKPDRSNPVAVSETAPAKASSPVVAKGAVMEEIGFTSLAAGRSMLTIETDRMVGYDVTTAKENEIRLTLKGTRIPAYHQRPLITTRFESALDRAYPRFRKGDQNAVIVMELRERVPYLVDQEENRISVTFDPSAVPPRSVAKAGLPDWKQALEEPVVVAAAPEEPQAIVMAEAEVAPMPAADTGAKSHERHVIFGEKTEFTGTPISLDFYETDIKNVFRILQHISGKNFAIDKDVSGKVTMSLEHPVPWDQIMDLVLRMNGLGLVEEGNIIRVATLDTLRKEESVRRAVIEAQQENLQKARELAPLMTEYMLINYSDAGSEVVPHIEKLLTDRGSVTADVRNNQIILTDTAEVIEKAKAVIDKIDRITPQVVIEARIVEATDTFSRKLGAEWNGSTSKDDASKYATIYKEALGGNYGYNVAMDTPKGSSTIGLHFARITGTPLALNATLNLSETKKETKIISSPRVVTLDNKTATINQGFEYPYTTRDESGELTTEFKQVDLKLEVTPHVTADNRVSMKVSIDKNDIFEQTSDGPALQTKKVETELLVNDGDTIVIGGVVQTNKTDQDNKIPFIWRIPVLGWLFRSEDTNTTKSEVLIFITPRIVQLENTGVS